MDKPRVFISHPFSDENWVREFAKSLQQRGLNVWFDSHSIPLGLAHQLRRAAVSIPANIAEGFGKRSQPEKARFLNIAEGSVEECRYYLILSQDLGYGQSKSMMSALEETSKLLNAYARAILASSS
jgi:four helix bundle protein